jgi:bacterioferritin-associated ferredoxin
MIVCSCNVLTDVAIRTSLAAPNGPRRVCDVYASLGCAAKCGGCAGTICALMRESKSAGAKAGIDMLPYEGCRRSQSGVQQRTGCDAESVWRIAAPAEAALELVGGE